MRNCGNAENFKQTQKERRQNQPRRLPLHRPRALTYPIPAKTSRLWNPFQRKQQQQTFDQRQSALLSRLPVEIRRLIWADALGGQLLHIARAPKRLLAIPCAKQERASGLNTRLHGCWGSTTGRVYLGTTPGFYLQPRSSHGPRPANLLPLLQTCRIVYTEAISILYEENTFDINHLDTILYLQRSVLLQRLNQIRSVSLAWDFRYATAASPPPYDLDTWRHVCSVLATFTGLHELTMHLSGAVDIGLGAHPKYRWVPLLGSLTCIKPKEKFDVYLPWSEEECIEAAEEERYHFRLISAPIVPLDDDKGNILL